MSQAATFRGFNGRNSTMPARRTSIVVPTAATGGETKQANVDVYSYSGSHVSTKSTSRSRSQKRITELKEKYLDEELQLGPLQIKLRYRRELVKVRIEAEISGIRARLQRERNELEQVSGVPTDNVSQLENYMEDYRAHVERRPATEPVESNPPDVRPTVVDNAMATALQQVVKRQELPEVELTHFHDHPENYWKCALQFRFDVKSKVEVDSKYLVYLLNRCKGCANESIGECISLRFIRSLVGARKILSGLLGQTHQVSGCYWIDD
ncbi:hypothetical protein PHET_00002 [Paragonimus heterotremus]|uniref:Uncharacterized protein n=1 Tax=Paragonimus heterotremus TaxID=100268 RepID=A0A8J4TFK2_9TREM|nr:hypothetical protein PHET_00002 [Paragonimus heterotremus]